VLPIDGLSIYEGWKSTVAVAVVWAYELVAFLITFALGLVVFVRLRTKTWFDIVLIASIYVLSEWLGSLLFGVLNMSNNSYWFDEYTLFSPAYLIAESDTLRIAARLGGVYALMFIQAFIGALIGAFFVFTEGKHRRNVYIVAAVSICCIIGLFFYEGKLEMHENKSNGLTVALVQTDSRASQKNIDEYILAAKEAGVDMLIFPEDYDVSYRSMTPQEKTIGIVNTPYTFSEPFSIIDSLTEHHDDGGILRINYHHAGGLGVQHGYKQLLLPGGETQPLLLIALLSLFGQSDIVETVSSKSSKQGSNIGELFIEQGVPLSVRLCSEAISPRLYRSDVVAGAQVLVNIASHAWFHNSSRADDAMRRIAKVRATELGRYYAKSSIDAKTYLIGSTGRELAVTPLGAEEVLVVDVYPQTDKTLYAALGSWTLLVPISICFGVYLWIRNRRELTF